MNLHHLARIALFVGPLATAAAQTRSPHIAAGWELDTTAAPGAWNPQRGSILETWPLWRDYLTARIQGEPRPELWLADERAHWPEYDLTSFLAYQDLGRTAVTVLTIQPPAPDVRDTVVIRTLFAHVSIDSAGKSPVVRPLALTRLYAVRTQAGWRLSNALPHVTARWTRVTEGPITFIYSPSTRPDPARRRAAARFVDSLANVFRVPPPKHIDYVVTSSGEEAYRVLGFDYAVIGAVTAGKTFIGDHLIVAGDARQGEAYFHELAHIVLAPLAPPNSTPALLTEGLATWAGGSLGYSYRAVLEQYAAFLHEHPRITLDILIDGTGSGDSGYRPGGALLCQLVFDVGGLTSLHTLLVQARSGDVRHAVESATGLTWAQFAARWQARARNGPPR